MRGGCCGERRMRVPNTSHGVIYLGMKTPDVFNCPPEVGQFDGAGDVSMRCAARFLLGRCRRPELSRRSAPDIQLFARVWTVTDPLRPDDLLQIGQSAEFSFCEPERP